MLGSSCFGPVVIVDARLHRLIGQGLYSLEGVVKTHPHAYFEDHRIVFRHSNKPLNDAHAHEG